MDVGQIVLSIVVTLLILTGLIVVHEFGHYMVAKKRGIAVSEFAVGFGPKLVKWTRNGTEFSIRAIFIGGFVRFADDVEGAPKEGDFRAASLKSRVLTIVAGPAMNVIVAVVLAVVFLASFGERQAIIMEVIPNTPAYEAGLEPGDAIRNMNGTSVDFYDYDVQNLPDSEGLTQMELTVERDGKKIDLSIPYAEVDGQSAIGITFGPEIRPFGVGESFALSLKWIGIQIREIVKALGGLFFMGQVENVGGIVMTAAVVGQAVHSGISIVVMLIALISVNLAIINLLPIPALDGGKLVMYAVEGVRKKPAPERLEGILNMIGFAFIIGLAIFLVVQDVGRLIPG